MTRFLIGAGGVDNGGCPAPMYFYLLVYTTLETDHFFLNAFHTHKGGFVQMRSWKILSRIFIIVGGFFFS
jgi:hypothetical protein